MLLHQNTDGNLTDLQSNELIVIRLFYQWLSQTGVQRGVTFLDMCLDFSESVRHKLWSTFRPACSVICTHTVEKVKLNVQIYPLFPENERKNHRTPLAMIKLRTKVSLLSSL